MLLTSLQPSRERAMVSRWKEEFERYGLRREQKQKILVAISEGYDTLVEIQNETGIPRTTCYKILRRLVQDNSITKPFVNNSNSRNELRFEVTTGK